jgi:propane monooxygenase coupling protein
MNESVESRAIAEVMAQVKGITVTCLPAMIRIDGKDRITFKMSEISEVLGRTMTPHLFEVCISTHYGRMVMVDDDTVVLFGDLDEALKHIEH